MRTAKVLSNPWSTAALVEELDDTTLKSGHALLDHLRAKNSATGSIANWRSWSSDSRTYSTSGADPQVARTVTRVVPPRLVYAHLAGSPIAARLSVTCFGGRLPLHHEQSDDGQGHTEPKGRR